MIRTARGEGGTEVEDGEERARSIVCEIRFRAMMAGECRYRKFIDSTLVERDGHDGQGGMSLSEVEDREECRRDREATRT